MGWTKYQYFLVVLLVVTGTFNTLSTKWADSIESEGADGTIRSFTHPFFQAVLMFLGELSCLLVFKLLYFYYKMKDNSQDHRELLKGNRDFSVWIFCLPAMCDIIGTSLIYIGLNLTYASSFQMLRGSLIIFVALLSVTFLQRRISWREWIGIYFVIGGLLIVGVSDVMSNRPVNSDGNGIITGDLLIVLAQIVTASQVVLEEHFVAGKDIPPLQAVGWEGIFGAVILGFLLIPLYYIHVGRPISNSPEGRLEDLNDAFCQIKNNLLLLLPLAGNLLSIGFFNFAGISVTKELSGTTRTVLDSLRTFSVWAMSLLLGWQAFSALQIFGFFVLLIGLFIYNNIAIPTAVKRIKAMFESGRQPKRGEPLISQSPDEVNY